MDTSFNKAGARYPIDNIAELFFTQAQQQANKMAILEKRKSITYGQLSREVMHTAAYLQKNDIRKGDRVLVFVPMGISLYRVVLALFYVGATAVFLDEWTDQKRLSQLCEIADCKGFIGTRKARFFSLISSSLRKIPVHLSSGKKIFRQPEICRVHPSDPALITFTTGSTGRPKAGLRTHGFLWEQFLALSEELQAQPSEIDLPTLPIVLFMNLGIGCTSVIPNFNSRKLSSLRPARIFRQLQQHKVSRLTASPSVVNQIGHYAIQKNLQLPALQKVITGGGPVFPVDAVRIHNAFPNAKCSVIYGSTEAEPISSISTTELSRRERDLSEGLPVGRPFHRTKVQIIDLLNTCPHSISEEKFNQCCLPNGKIGEIVVAGPHILKQYFNNPIAFEKNKILVNGTLWHKTGDAGFISNGELFLTGRRTQMIRRNGQWISPFIIENQLQKNPDIRAGTLLEDQDRLFLVVESDRSADKLQASLKNLPYDEIITVKHLPKDPRHFTKIDYQKVRDLIRRES